MKRRWLIIALLLSVGVNIGVLATLGVGRARGPRPMRGGYEHFDGDRGQRMERMAKWLQLEGEGRELFFAQHQEFFDRLQGVRGDLKQTRQDLRLEVGSPEPDAERIEELLSESARLMSELDRVFIDNVLATRRILDPRQQKAYVDFLSRMRDRGERSDRGGDRGRRGAGDRHPGTGLPI